MAWVLWPFRAAWKLMTIVLEVTGRVLLAILGLVLMGLGVGLAMTIAGAPVGIPLAILGLLLTIRSLF